MAVKIKITSESLLVVEGNDELEFFTALHRYLEIENVQIIDIAGKDNFKAGFIAFYMAEGFDKVEKIGFVRDAEKNRAASAFISICGILQQCKLPQPPQPNTLTNTTPKIGVFIMPDNDGCGMLEDLCLETITSHPIKTCIDNFLTCFTQHQNEHEASKFNPQKACVQAYLSTRAPIVHSLGLGAQKGYWDFDHPCFDSIKSFLTTLFL